MKEERSVIERTIERAREGVGGGKRKGSLYCLARPDLSKLAAG